MNCIKKPGHQVKSRFTSGHILVFDRIIMTHMTYLTMLLCGLFSILQPYNPRIKKNSSKRRILLFYTNKTMCGCSLGVSVIAIGMLLMGGGRSNDPNVFNYDEVYSTLRISVAPYYYNRFGD